jgi:hypothetical protein
MASPKTPAERAERGRVWHRRLQSAGISLCVMGIGWAANTLMKLDRAMGETKTAVEYLQGDHYQVAAHDRALADLKERVGVMAERLIGIDRRIVVLEGEKYPPPARTQIGAN